MFNNPKFIKNLVKINNLIEEIIDPGKKERESLRRQQEEERNKKIEEERKKEEKKKKFCAERERNDIKILDNIENLEPNYTETISSE